MEKIIEENINLLKKYAIIDEVRWMKLYFKNGLINHKSEFYITKIHKSSTKRTYNFVNAVSAKY